MWTLPRGNNININNNNNNNNNQQQQPSHQFPRQMSPAHL